MQKVASILTFALCAGALARVLLAGPPERELRGRFFWVDGDGTRSPASEVELVTPGGELVRSGDGGRFRCRSGPPTRPARP